MNITVLGSGQEVGGSAILVEDRKTKLLLDSGVKVHPEPPTYPKPPPVDACILSHAHLDHIGSAPSRDCPVYMNDVTLELSTMLLYDSLQVAKKNRYKTPFSKKEVKRFNKEAKLVTREENILVNDFHCKLYDSGHIPGSSGVLVNDVFYTSDIQTIETQLLNPCALPKRVKTLIIESTYSYRNHPPRKEEEKKFIEAVEEGISKDETALIPVFAVGRAQEILLILKKYADIIALDGMTRTASDIIEQYRHYLRDPKLFSRILHKVNFVNGHAERQLALDRCPVIIASAGMLAGGPAVHYLREIRKKPESSVIFTGFLGEDTPGRLLMETGIFQNEEEKFSVHCEREQFNLSAHADHNGLLDIVHKLNPENIICVHGDRCKEFAQELSKLGFTAHAPSNNETVKV